MERLAEMGLEDVEARIYVHLLKAGPSKAGDLARALSVARAEVYRVLQGLVQREIIAASLTRPVTFRATPVDQLFDEIVAQERRRVARIEQAQEGLRTALSRMQAGTEGLPGPSFRLLHGRRAVSDAVERLIAGARREVLVLDTHPSASQIGQSLGLSGLSRERLRDGVAFRVLLADSPAQRHAIAQRGGDSRVRLVTMNSRGRLLLVDDRVAVVGIVTDASSRMSAEGDAALWSDSPVLVIAQRALFEALWEKSPAADGAPP